MHINNTEVGKAFDAGAEAILNDLVRYLADEYIYSDSYEVASFLDSYLDEKDNIYKIDLTPISKYIKKEIT